MADEIAVNQWLTEKEAAKYLGCSRSTLRRMVSVGALACYRAKRHPKIKRFKRIDLNALMIADEVVAPAELEWDPLECGMGRPKFPPAELEN